MRNRIIINEFVRERHLRLSNTSLSLYLSLIPFLPEFITDPVKIKTFGSSIESKPVNLSHSAHYHHHHRLHHQHQHQHLKEFSKCAPLFEFILTISEASLVENIRTNLYICITQASANNKSKKTPFNHVLLAARHHQSSRQQFHIA